MNELVLWKFTEVATPKDDYYYWTIYCLPEDIVGILPEGEASKDRNEEGYKIHDCESPRVILLGLKICCHEPL